MEDILEKLNIRNDTVPPFTYEATNVDGLLKFLQTIDWSEKWLIGLIAFHLITMIFILITRRCSNVQILTFLSLLGLCYFSEKINELGANNWRTFALEQYFDANGLFISVVFSGPIIINCTIIVIMWLYESYTLLVKIVKIKKKSLQTAQAKANTTNDSNKEPSDSSKKDN